MIIDTSAIVAIVWKQPEWERYLRAIEMAPVRLMSAVTLYETAVVIYSKRQNYDDDVTGLWELLSELKVQIEPFGAAEAAQAAVAYQRYGKGVHPAGLNLGDCPAFSLADTKKMPLLYTGNDFSRTSITSAL